MFDLFSSVFKVDGDGAVATMPTDSVARDPDIVALRALFAGMSFNRGLYRVLENSVAGTIQRTVGHAFPALAARIECFGVDWLGRVFSADSGRRIDGKSAVVMLEPGSGQALEMPCHVTSFHDEEICECADAALADGFSRKWLASGGASPMVSQCVGYKRPLFLGGRTSFIILNSQTSTSTGRYQPR
ncbi:DUF1851 domain-containing protein (plasmid) [Paraburkholderia sp. PREW-6R]|uniref:DUF1851 domain-containing protein n=1 Tax=Paraburkholderia sp. PREW-6R TaxID=3141544 RepID=UPI0031F525EC